MDEDILRSVMTFFKRYSKSSIDKNTEINNELGLIGDDADAMLLEFMEKFNVNFEDIDFSNYFVPELLFKYWYYRWFAPEKLKRLPVTIAHMSRVVEKGEWFDPE